MQRWILPLLSRIPRRWASQESISVSFRRRSVLFTCPQTPHIFFYKTLSYFEFAGSARVICRYKLRTLYVQALGLQYGNFIAEGRIQVAADMKKHEARCRSTTWKNACTNMYKLLIRTKLWNITGCSTLDPLYSAKKVVFLTFYGSRSIDLNSFKTHKICTCVFAKKKPVIVLTLSMIESWWSSTRFTLLYKLFTHFPVPKNYYMYNLITWN